MAAGALVEALADVQITITTIDLALSAAATPIALIKIQEGRLHVRLILLNSFSA